MTDGPESCGQRGSRRFFGKQIEVTTEGEPRRPVSFLLDDKLYIIEEILVAWPDHGFGATSGKRHRWWQRRHRNYYQVRTTDEEVFEIYYDRGVSLKHPRYRKWYVTRRM